MSWTGALAEGELAPGQARVVVVGEERILLCRLTEDEVYAVEDTCSHDDGPLGEGTLEGGQIECPRHGARFDVRTGAALRMPAASPIATYPARIQGGVIEVDLEELP